ncbi:hypothetical protein ES703_66510 [subsurface metagenome]
MGDTGKIIKPIISYCQTTTTQISDFTLGGNRSKHDHYILKAHETPFDQDCVIDLHIPPLPFEIIQLEKNEDIEIKGQLDLNTLKVLYNKILKSRCYSKMEKSDIHTSLNLIGITGLKKPK